MKKFDGGDCWFSNPSNDGCEVILEDYIKTDSGEEITLEKSDVLFCNRVEHHGLLLLTQWNQGMRGDDWDPPNDVKRFWTTMPSCQLKSEVPFCPETCKGLWSIYEDNPERRGLFEKRTPKTSLFEKFSYGKRKHSGFIQT